MLSGATSVKPFSSSSCQNIEASSKRGTPYRTMYDIERCMVFCRSFEPQGNRNARLTPCDDLAFPIYGRPHTQAPRLAAHEHTRAAPSKLTAATQALARVGDANRPEAAEWLAKLTVVIGDKKRQAEDAGPHVPFGKHIVCVERCKQWHRQCRVPMLQCDRNHTRIGSVGGHQPHDNAAEHFDWKRYLDACAAHRASQDHAFAV